MCEPQLTKFAQVRPLGTSFRYQSDNNNNNGKTRFSYFYPSHDKSSEIQQNCDKDKTSNFSSSQIKQNEGHFSDTNKLKSNLQIINVSNRRRAKSSDSTDNEYFGAYKSSKMEVSGSAMQSLDRRISASSDQLDTLKKQKNREKPLRTRSSSRLAFERK